ncbi:MAG: hypothetical protein RSA73_05765 [Anaerovoracaceae bacterium]
MGNVQNPKGIVEKISGKTDVQIFGASDIAEKLGNPKAMNIVLLGAW